MNHFKLLLPLILLGAVPCNAQEVHFSAGFNGSNISRSGDEHWKGLAGFQFGGDVLIGQRWFIKPGLHYVSRNLNYTYNNGIDAGTVERKYTSKSLAIPVMIGTYFLDPAEETSFNFYVMGGPTALLGLSANMNNDELEIKTNPAQWYVGFAGGLEFSFIFIEAGYDVAMSKVFDGDALDTNPKVNIIHANAGVRLRLAK